MIRIHGPTYRFQGETITDEIIYIDDHCYDEHTHSFPVKTLLDHNPGDHLLVFDHLAHDDVLRGANHVCLPVYLAWETNGFIRQKIQPDWNDKRSCFNFMINKPRTNRIAVLDFVQHNNLRDRRHTLAWQHSRWPDISVTDFRIGNEITLECGIRNGSYTNAETYQFLLQKQVFEPTCVSMITEPCYHEREAMITEKTIMALLAGTLPVWVGGWRLPDVMRDLGFDVFDDIVDHSYSTLTTAEARTQSALDLNRRLFSDFDFVSSYISANHHRLRHNVDLIHENVFLALVRRRCDQDPRLRDIAHLWALSV